MIHSVVTSIALKLDEFIKNKLSLSDDAVIISSLVDIKGNINQDVENKITIFILNIEEEKISKNVNFKSNLGANPPVKISVLVMFSAYFPNFNYVESLRYISLVIEFFQNHSIFDSSNTIGMPLSINKIHAEMFNSSLDEINKLWGNIGGNYVPSVSYKLKHLIFDGQMFSEDIPRILGAKNKLTN